jgi:SAM-dependent methyltransferase
LNVANLAFNKLGGPHGLAEPSAWVRRWTHLAKPGGSMLDIACGQGRHMAWFAAQGFAVTGVDLSVDAVQAASAYGEAFLSDIENTPWPLMQSASPRQFDVVVVTNYLWRSLVPTILHSLAPGGVLLYETFAVGHETLGKPSRADFLLRPGELLQVCQGLDVVAYENGFLTSPDRFVQRIAAVARVVRKDANPAPSRYPLSLE